MYFITIWDDFTSVWVYTALDHCTFYARVEMVFSEAINDFWVVAGMMAFMWGISDFCSIWKSTLMIEYMCMRPLSQTTSDPLFLHRLWFRCKVIPLHLLLTYIPLISNSGIAYRSHQETQLRVHTHPSTTIRGIGVLMAQVVNFWAIQGRSQWTRSPLFLPTHEMLLRWLLRGQVLQAEQSPAVSHGQFWNAGFFKNLSIVVLYHRVSFCCQQSQSATRIHVSPLFCLFPFRSPQSSKQSSLCYSAGSH